MTKTRLLAIGILLVIFNTVFSQSKTRTLSYEDYNSKSLEFIEYLKNTKNFENLKDWFEGEVNDELMGKLNSLSQFVKPRSEEITVYIEPYGKVPENNKPLVIYYLLVNKETKYNYGLFLGYLDDKDLIIDDIKTLKFKDGEEEQKNILDSTLIPSPQPPPQIIKNKS